MESDEVVEQPREICDDAPGIDWETKFCTPNIPRLSLVANSFLFELKKASIKWRRSFALLARRKLANRVKRQRRRLERSTDSRDSSLTLELGAQLSSIFPKLGVFASVRSAPDRLLLIRRKGLLDLDGVSLLNIVQRLDDRSLFCFARVCHQIRNVILNNITSLPKIKSALHDMYIDLNKHSGLEDARVMKCGRSAGAISYSARSIQELLPPMLCCQLRIHFGNNVLVNNWLPDIYCLYKECRLCPTAFIFSGGSLSEVVGRCRFAGADLSSLSERGFITMVSQFAPHLKEVQLATSRLFQLSTSPYFLFSMIDLLSVFGMTYEQKPIHYDVEDICRIICLWRHSSRSHSCEVYIREPRGCDEVNWVQFGTVETDGGNRVKAVKVEPVNLVKLEQARRVTRFCLTTPLKHVQGNERPTVQQ